MARIIARFRTTGTVEVFHTEDGVTERYVFSHLSSATSYDRAQQNARRAVLKAVCAVPHASGYQIQPGVTTVRLLSEESTSEPRLRMELGGEAPVVEPSPVEGYRVKQRIAAEDLQRTLEHASKEAAHLEPGFSSSFLRSDLQKALSLLIDFEVNAACARAYLEATKGA